MNDVVTRVSGRAGHITLNRPAKLNALTREMCLVVEAALDGWRDDPAVRLVLIDAEGPRAFCAGGDMAAVARAVLAGDHRFGHDFFRDEYRLNAKIAARPKPVVSFMQGLTMGGGVGLGGHASHRIVGETTQIAMPETAIGLVPDVGGSLILARAPGAVGEYLGVTGARIGAADAIFAGFADRFVPEADWPALKGRLAETGDAGALPEHAAPAATLPARLPLLGRLFADPSPAGLLDGPGREAADDPCVAALRDALARFSPLSILATLELIRRTRAAGTIEAALRHEFRFTTRAARDGDLVEGVRARLIDRDNAPRWKHRTITDVAPQEVAAMLAPPDEGDIW